MAATITSRKRTLVIKAESTRGTSVFGSMTNADFDIPFKDISFSKNIEFHEAKYAAGDHDHFASIVGRQPGSINASCDLRWSGTNDTPPNISKALQMCGALETVNATTSVVWTPNKSKDAATFTCLVQDEVIGASPNALGIQLRGAMANGKLVMDALGMPIRLDLEITGVLDAIADITNANILAITSPDTAVADSVRSATITLASIAQRIDKFEFDFGNVVELENDPSASEGLLAAYIAERNPQCNLDPLADLLANDAEYTRMVAGTESALAISTAHFALAASKVQEIASTDAQQQNAVSWDKTLKINRVSGSDAWSLTHS